MKENKTEMYNQKNPKMNDSKIDNTRTESGIKSALRDAGKDPGILYVPIGGTVFKVRIRTAEGAGETIEDKILRMMQRDVTCGAMLQASVKNDFTPDFVIFLPTDPKICVIIEAPQTDRLPERSSACA